MPVARQCTRIALSLLLLLSFLVVPVSVPGAQSGRTTFAAEANVARSEGITDGAPSEARTSHRLIVELDAPPLTQWAQTGQVSVMQNGRLDVHAPAAQTYIRQLQSDQAAFVNRMQQALPAASVSTFFNERGMPDRHAYQITFNGVAIDPGTADVNQAIQRLRQLPGVRAVYRDYAYTTGLYTSTTLINAPAVWNSAAIGGIENAGAGIRIASMDGGVHHAAPMFDGTGYSYPPGYPLGDTANTNGKIIVSRAYFRSWDPPAPGDENTWPGENGTSHGVHTASIAAGDVVTATYVGYDVGEMSGVAPKAYVMSYRVFYGSVSGDGSFYTAEGLAALEDIVADGADVVNNSWGGGPSSAGGEFDPLDQALINAADAGVFVSMSAGNAGPGNGTTDHPSDDYIVVAASTTSGTLATGALNVTAPEPVDQDLQGIPFGTAEFGEFLDLGQVFTYPFITAASVDAANVEGCNAWTGTPFADKAVLISRGSCTFSSKVRYAQQAGADFVVIYNNADDTIINMACGDTCDDITIPSVFVGKSDGDAMVAWYDTHGNASELELSTVAFQSGNTPDQIASFSSRGPGVGEVLKPDIAAPGVNILAHGYTPGATGEARHLGYGQVSGTSMASPHVAGAAALLRQIYPTWSNAQIKSALMSTAKYLDVYNFDGSPAQPLDMGAGRLDVEAALDPGVILSPPSLSFGSVVSGTTEFVTTRVTNITGEAETYTLSTLYTGDGFDDLKPLAGFTISPTVVTLQPGQSAVVRVTFDPAAGQGIGDNQGYIVMEGDQGHEAHMPVWARVVPATPSAEVLLIDNDASSTLGLPDYTGYYTSTLEALGLTYDIWNADANFNNPVTIPDAATLSQYKAVIYYTGDNFYPNGFFTVATPLTALDMNRLVEYANQGGIVIAMGQDLASVLDSTNSDTASFFYDYVLGGEFLQDSVTDTERPTQPIVPLADAPPAFDALVLDVSGAPVKRVDLFGANEVPPVSTTTKGWADLSYDAANRILDYTIYVTATDTLTVTATHIHTGTVGTNGGVLYPIFPFTDTQVITDTPLTWSDQVQIAEEHVAALLNGGLYINVHTTDNPGGEIRGQISVEPGGDGAGNQYYIDELSPRPLVSPDNPEDEIEFTPLLQYPGPHNDDAGVVAMAHRDQPTLEIPGVNYYGRSVYASFGLEGVNNGVDSTTRAELLEAFLNWAMDEPEATIEYSTDYSDTTQVNVFEVSLTSNISGTTGAQYRWDFGDGSGYAGPYTSNTISHAYDTCGTYTVRVEVVDSWGNHAIGSTQVEVTQACSYRTYMPITFK